MKATPDGEAISQRPPLAESPLGRYAEALDPDPEDQHTGAARRGRFTSLLAASRDMVRIAHRDPEHIAERLTLTAVQRLGQPSLDWARAALREPGVQAAVIAQELHRQSARLARIDGAVAATPFFVALVPGYLAFLRQEARMTLSTAALYGHDPRELKAAAQLLVLRGVHPTIDAAETALETVRTTPLPEKPSSRRSLRTWVGSVYTLLVLGGFCSPRDKSTRGHAKLEAVAGLLIGLATWGITWVFPVTLMAVMAWSCEHNARDLGRRALMLYGGQAPTTKTALAAARRRDDEAHRLRRAGRTTAVVLSVAAPIAFIAVADHVRHTTGVNGVGALGALVALSLVLATAVVAKRA